MDSEDEFYDTMFNEVLESSSSDDEDDLYVAAAHKVAEANDKQPYRRGSIDGHRVLNRDRQSRHSRLFQDYFSDVLRMGRTILGGGLYFPLIV